MSSLRVTGQRDLVCLMDGDFVSAWLECDKPLLQYIKRESLATTPDWSNPTNQPTIYAVATSQALGKRVSIDTDSPVWMYNDLEILFDSSGVSTLPKGVFQKGIFKDGDISSPSLKIIDNLAGVNTKNNINISLKADIDIPTISSTILANIVVKISEVFGESYDGLISATNGGVISQSNPKVKLRASMYLSGEPMGGKYTVNWSKQTSMDGGYTPVPPSGDNDKEIDVLAEDVDNQAVFKADFLISGVVKASAFKTVYDETDPFVMEYNITSGTEQMRVNEHCEYEPYVRRRGSSIKETGFTFTYVIRDHKGDVIETRNGPKLRVDGSFIEKHTGFGKGVSIYFEANKKV